MIINLYVETLLTDKVLADRVWKLGGTSDFTDSRHSDHPKMGKSRGSFRPEAAIGEQDCSGVVAPFCYWIAKLLENYSGYHGKDD